MRKPSPTAAAVVAPVKADFAGRSGGGMVALSVRDGKAVAYFCDGKREAWLEGDVRENRADLFGTRDTDIRITATLASGRVTGTLDLGESPQRFVASTVRKPSGLYRATARVRGAKVVGGWIVLADGRQVGAVSVDGVPAPAPRLEPGRDVRTDDGTTLRPRDVDAFFQEVVT
ncbi:hypothetical protein HII36_06285 [Nonomuraea sp. NN258]|uniref:hypothetical protein n=1 Tax=Nonomuraea antri TaxID=2730852 RepID=UPI001569A74E|nr:hypothetical protein [Nonomuraea antri]NRQ31449.1 hypothetical protein [Nonomuraea antri]